MLVWWALSPARGRVLCGVWVWWVVGVYHRVQTVGESQPIVSECVFAHVDGLFFLARGHKTHPSPSLVSEGDGMGSLPLPGDLPVPPRPALPAAVTTPQRAQG